MSKLTMYEWHLLTELPGQSMTTAMGVTSGVIFRHRVYCGDELGLQSMVFVPGERLSNLFPHEMGAAKEERNDEK